MSPRVLRRPSGPGLVAPLLAVAVALAGVGLGWRGVDLPAQIYRVELVRRDGAALWDSQWYGGHWLLSYSAVVPFVAAVAGTSALLVAAAAVAAAAFDRLVRVGGFAPAALPASAVFALGTGAQVAIGQVTFLCGEAAGMVALVALARHRWAPAALAAAVAAACSPLDGAFTCLAVAAFGLSSRDLTGNSPAGDSPTGRSPSPRRLTRRSPSSTGPGRRPIVSAGWLASRRGPMAVLAAGAAPVLFLSFAFPGDGVMPYPAIDWLWELGVGAGVLVAARHHHVLRTATALYLLALTGSELVPSPLGGNIGRLEDIAALPLAVALLWRHRLSLAAVAVPLVLSQWGPAWPAMTSLPADAWTHAAYYRPMVAWVERAGGPAGRIEVVPTAAHYESAYVAPQLALARGWERQLDEADAALFYRPGLDATAYRAWLVSNGVRWVALASAPVDISGRAEAALLRSGVPGLERVWSDRRWQVWSVGASTGIAGPGATAVSAAGGSVTVEVDRPGAVVVRERWTPAWRVTSGPASVRRAPGGWVELDATEPGLVALAVHWP